MAKKNRNRKKAPARTTAKRPGREVALKRAGEEVRRAAFAPPADLRPALEHYRRLLNYEAWVAEGDFSKPPDFGDLPPSYLMALERWPEAFEYVRHHMFMYVGTVVGHSPWGEMLVSITRRALAADANIQQSVVDELAAAHERFLRQYREATRSLRDANASEPVAHLRSALHGWTAIYETDLPLWFIGVLGKALREGVVDLAYLGGPNTSTAQGSLINTLRCTLEGTPLLHVLDAVYDAKLRNALNHNDYELIEDRGRVVLRDGTGHEWDYETLWDLIVAAQNMLQSVLLAAQVVQATKDSSVGKYSDAGVVSMTYTVREDGFPIVVVNQLWCFRDLDPSGTWLDEATLRLSDVGQDTETISLTDRATLSGVPLSATRFGEALRTTGWAWVHRMPVAPCVGLGLPTIQNVEGETLEIVGPVDRHLVPVRIS